jgi:hypothetical protein
MSAMSIGSARDRRSAKLHYADILPHFLLRTRRAPMLLLFELFVIFAILGLGAVGVVKVVDRVLDEHASPAGGAILIRL